MRLGSLQNRIHTMSFTEYIDILMQGFYLSWFIDSLNLK